MLPVEFLTRLTPDRGYKCIATPTDRGGFAHHVCETHEQAATLAAQLDAQGKDVFFALSSFREARVRNPKWVEGSNVSPWSYRIGSNALQVKAFWLDLDVSADKPGRYPTQTEAVAALKRFVEATGLPRPMLVSSGYGVHVYWPLAAPVDVEQWFVAAEQLKALTVRLGLLTDPTRTADRASVLRLVGTHNYKHGLKRPVRVLADGADVAIEAFVACLARNGCAPRTPVSQAGKPSSEFDSVPDNISSGVPVSEGEILSRCAQMRSLKLVGGDVPEPYWYAGLQLLQHVDGGYDLKAAYSSGHEGYDEDATEAKWAQLNGVGPTTCARFEMVNPGGCEGCVYRGQIKSPIVLGRKAGQAEPPEVVVTVQRADGEASVQRRQAPDPPAPFARTADGKITITERKRNEENGAPEEVTSVIYDHDLYPIKQLNDPAQGGQVTIFRTTLPHDGAIDFSIRAEELYDRKALMKIIASVGVYPKPNNIPKLAAYMIGYIAETQKFAAAQKQFAQMGWHDNDTKFLNGATEYRTDGSVHTVGVSDALKNSVKSMGSKGDLDTWKRMFNVYAQPGFEAHAFAALTAFGAPIFKFSGYAGVMLNMVGEGGSGKSTVLRMINSVYGDPDGPMLIKDDTVLSFYHRLGVANNLPVTFDEVTNMEPKNLSTLCYAISQGRGKNRLKQDGTERENMTSWQTIIASTSNASLFDKLANYKTDASAESMRVFEYYVNQTHILTKQQASQIFAPLADNYGVAGDVYLRYVTTHVDEIKKAAAAIMKRFDERMDTPVRERFWSSLIAYNFAGGMVAKKIGLHNYDMNALFEWIVKQVQFMRTVVTDNTLDPRAVLSGFLNKSLQNTLVVRTSNDSKDASELAPPRGPLLVRAERRGSASGKVSSLIYMSQHAFKAYCVEVGADYTMAKRALEESRIILNPKCMKVLGAGTNWTSTGQTLCWLIDGDHAQMGGLSLRAVGSEATDLMETANNG